MSNFVLWTGSKFYRFLSKFPPTRRIAAKRFTRLYEKISPVPVIRSSLAGFPLNLDLSKGIDRAIFLHGAYDLRGILAIRQVMKQLRPRTAWDVGANRGNHAAFMRPHCHRLFCFEPNPDESKRLMELFYGDKDVTVLEIGLSDVSAILPFLVYDKESGNSTFEINPNEANANLRVEIGDEIARNYGINDLDFVKIDVEGHEAKVLLGMSSLIRHQRPVIIFEILKAQSTHNLALETLLPDYLIYGNRTGFISKITMSAYKFCEFEYGKTYMCALAVPTEKKTFLKALLPN